MTQTVLLVEDEGDIREVYAEILRDGGYTVVEAVDGEEALLKSSLVNWDIMLLDIMLPKVDGLEVLKRIRSDAKDSHKPVILLTNLGRESIIKEGFELGANGYLIKSELTPDQVVAEVKGFLGK
ncbi:MAG: response regulator [candidate division WWE3 bacterium]|nr:response regulator [candidate division WWE3 bacterium]